MMMHKQVCLSVVLLMPGFVFAQETGSSVERKIIEQVKIWGEKTRTAKASLSTESASGKSLDLGKAIARVFGRPTAEPGALSGSVDRVTMTVNAAMASEPDRYRLAELRYLLRGVKGTSKNICLSAPQSEQTTIGVSASAVPRVLELLSVPYQSLAPVEFLQLKLGGEVVELDSKALGKELFDAVADQLRSGSTVKLWLDPRLRRSPVRLKLKTVQGETITLPAEINGAAQQLIMEPNTVWVTHPQDMRIKPDKALWGQLLMMWTLVGTKPGTQRSHITFAPSDLKRRYPTIERDLGLVHQFEVHAHGKADRWFGRRTLNVNSTLKIKRTSGACALRIKVQPSVTNVQLGPKTLADWTQVTGLTVVDPDRQSVTLGFLDPPYCGGAVQ